MLSGALAFTARERSSMNARVGTWFVSSMFVLFATAAILSALKEDIGSGLGGAFTCNLVSDRNRPDLVPGLYPLGPRLSPLQ